MCCEPSGFKCEEIDGECDECGNDTVNGEAYERCGYSRLQCGYCGYAPCDQSC